MTKAQFEKILKVNTAKLQKLVSKKRMLDMFMTEIDLTDDVEAFEIKWGLDESKPWVQNLIAVVVESRDTRANWKMRIYKREIPGSVLPFD